MFHHSNFASGTKSIAEWFICHLERQFYEEGERGRITSPGWPRNYYSNKNYFWRITAPQGRRIEVTFNEFEIESEGNCAKDYLKIFDSSSAGDSLLGTYCGGASPGSFKSSGRFLFINFRSNGDITQKGFDLRWNSFEEIEKGGYFWLISYIWLCPLIAEKRSSTKFFSKKIILYQKIAP